MHYTIKHVHSVQTDSLFSAGSTLGLAEAARVVLSRAQSEGSSVSPAVRRAAEGITPRARLVEVFPGAGQVADCTRAHHIGQDSARITTEVWAAVDAKLAGRGTVTSEASAVERQEINLYGAKKINGCHRHRQFTPFGDLFRLTESGGELGRRIPARYYRLSGGLSR